MLLPVLLACALALPAAPGAPAVDAPVGAGTVGAVGDGARTGGGGEMLRLRTEQAADGATRIDITAPVAAPGTASSTRAMTVRLLGGGRTLADLPVVDGHATLTTNTGVPAGEITACVLTAGGPVPARPRRSAPVGAAATPTPGAPHPPR
jgi:hypothetical protein